MKQSNLSTPRQMRDGMWTVGYHSAQEVPLIERIGGAIVGPIFGVLVAVLLAHWLAR